MYFITFHTRSYKTYVGFWSHDTTKCDINFMYNTRILNHAVVTDKFHQSPVLVLFLYLWIWLDLTNRNCRLHVTPFWVNKNVQTTKYLVIQENDLYRRYNTLACPWRAHTFNPQTSCMFAEINLGYMSLSSENHIKWPEIAGISSEPIVPTSVCSYLNVVIVVGQWITKGLFGPLVVDVVY